MLEQPVITTNQKFKHAASIVLFFIVQLLFVTANASLVWAGNYYGNISIDEIIFHISMPLSGTADYIVQKWASASANWWYIAIMFDIEIFLVWFLIRKKNNKFSTAFFKIKDFVLKWSWVKFLAWFLVMILLLNNYFGLFEWVRAQATNSTFIEEHYISAEKVDLIFPEQKRNLIHIVIESAETTNQDKSTGGIFNNNYMPEMTELSKSNVSFSHTEAFDGAAVAPACGWSIAGLVAQTAGIPLKLFKYEGGTNGIDNSMSKYANFLPGATTLGDILAKEGYRNIFVSGADWKFGGGSTYLTSHGNYEMYDYYKAVEEGVVEDGYFVWWGFEDSKVYEYGKTKLLELAESDQPFNFMITTCDTHSEDGYVCQLCQTEYGSDQYANVWRCASRQVNEFVEWIQAQAFYENTTIVIAGDHCSMDSNFYDSLTADRHAGSLNRKIYNCFINPATEPINEKNRKFTTLDMYPTILGSLGVSIEGNRLGLGTNLFSDAQTLAEEYGYEYFFEELNKKSAFYNHKLLYH